MRAVFSVCAAAGWLVAAVPAASHHSFAAEFDVSRPIAFTGTVTRIEWTNPHAWIHVDVEDPGGSVHNWAIELLGINSLVRRGWRHDGLQPGDQVGVEGFAARDGSTTGNASVIIIVATGERLWASSRSEDE